MTEVQFHVNVPDCVHYTCRLLRKALRKRMRVAVTGSVATLNELDQTLWSFEADEFVPHARVDAATPRGAVQSHAPVWLVDDPRDGAVLTVLVNLGRELAAGFSTYQRLIEIVADDDDSRSAARDRWRQYVALGYAPVKHEVVA
jgi:DNA polymerase III subunit chi